MKRGRSLRGRLRPRCKNQSEPLPLGADAGPGGGTAGHPWSLGKHAAGVRVLRAHDHGTMGTAQSRRQGAGVRSQVRTGRVPDHACSRRVRRGPGAGHRRQMARQQRSVARTAHGTGPVRPSFEPASCEERALQFAGRTDLRHGGPTPQRRCEGGGQIRRSAEVLRRTPRSDSALAVAALKPARGRGAAVRDGLPGAGIQPEGHPLPFFSKQTRRPRVARPLGILSASPAYIADLDADALARAASACYTKLIRSEEDVPFLVSGVLCEAAQSRAVTIHAHHDGCPAFAAPPTRGSENPASGIASRKLCVVRMPWFERSPLFPRIPPHSPGNIKLGH